VTPWQPCSTNLNPNECGPGNCLSVSPYFFPHRRSRVGWPDCQFELYCLWTFLAKNKFQSIAQKYSPLATLLKTLRCKSHYVCNPARFRLWPPHRFLPSSLSLLPSFYFLFQSNRSRREKPVLEFGSCGRAGGKAGT
jgi:hypothetical protein